MSDPKMPLNHINITFLRTGETVYQLLHASLFTTPSVAVSSAIVNDSTAKNQ